MIKKLFSISFVAALLLMGTSCADEELSPIITFDKAGKGAYVKLLSETARELDLANLDAAKYTYTIEFVDEDQGNTVTNYNLSVSYVDNNPDNGDDSAGPIDLKSFSSGEFGSTERGFKGMSDVSITLNELLSAFGLAADKIKANDQFQFVTTINTSNGGTFGASNSSAAVNGTAFAGHFNYTLKATCPIPDDVFAGTYKLTWEGDATGGFGLPFAEGDVTVYANKPSNTRRAMDLAYLPDFGGFAVTAGFDVVCEFITWETLDSGVGCGGGGIVLGDGPVTPISSLSDDGEIRLTIIEFEADGGCGVGAMEKTMVLTKN